MSEKTQMEKYEEELKKYMDGINTIQFKYALAHEKYLNKQLSKSQLKKVDAQVYNELREYKQKNERPIKRSKNGVSPTLAALLTLYSTGKY